MGIGAAYTELVDFINKTDGCENAEDGGIDTIISFVADSSIKAVKRQTDDYISAWYYQVRPSFTSCRCLQLTNLELTHIRWP